MGQAAKSILKLRDQINTDFPDRSKISDGIFADRAHSSRKSDHNENSAGVVTAIDITHDPEHGLNARALAELLVASKDKRIKYIISNAQIISSKQQPWVWRPYRGANAHRHHVHVSVNASPALYDDDSDWQIDLKSEATQPVASNEPELSNKNAPPLIQRGSKGRFVEILQKELNRRGFGELVVDADYGLAVERAVRAFQSGKGLDADGSCGVKTWTALGFYE